MDRAFWHTRWNANQIGFHEPEVNPLLIQHIEELNLASGARIFVPLCGKTLDIGWLLSRGFRVVGVELSEQAVQQLFSALGLEPQIAETPKTRHYHAEDIDIFVGDIFDLTPSALGLVDGIYDRAALVALPEPMRTDYACHVMVLTDQADQLLMTYTYDQAVASGPPFSIPAEEVKHHYGEAYDIVSLWSENKQDALKKRYGTVEETVWLLRRQSAG